MNNNKHSILLSIKPVYASLILIGKKTVELRKSFSKDAENSRIYLYSTSPVKKIVGAVDIKSVKIVLIDEIDANIIIKACVDEHKLHDYYKNNKTGTIIEVENPIEFFKPVELAQLRKMKHLPHNSHRKILKDEEFDKYLNCIYDKNVEKLSPKVMR